MATNEWGMLRDIFNEVADDHMQRIPPNTGSDPYQEAAGLANFAVAHAFRAVADKMRARGGQTPDELAVEMAKMSAEWRKRRQAQSSDEEPS